MKENTLQGRWSAGLELAGAVKQRWGGETEGADNSASLRSLAPSGRRGSKGIKERRQCEIIGMNRNG